MLVKLHSLEVARKRTAPLLSKLETEQRRLVIDTQRECLSQYAMQEEHLFSVKSFVPCEGLLPMFVILCRRHPDLLLSPEWVIAYLFLRESGAVAHLEGKALEILRRGECSDIANRARDICRNKYVRVRIDPKTGAVSRI